jgi:hypothetical protein
MLTLAAMGQHQILIKLKAAEEEELIINLMAKISVLEI